MTASLRRALIRAAFFATVLTCTAPLFAQTAFDDPPFSADPKALLAAAQKVDAKDLNVVYLLDEETISFEPDGRAKSVFRAIEYIVTEDGVESAGTASAAWAPWYDDKPVITARVITKDGTVHTLDPKAITESTAEEEQDMFSDQRVLRAPLPGVAAGAIVERVITLEGRSPIAGGGKYGLFLFGGNVPFERQRLVLDADPSIAPRIVNKSGFEPVTTEQNGRKHVVFEKGRGNTTIGPSMVIDLFNAGVEVQQDGSDEIGYRLRIRSTSGLSAAPSVAYYVQRRDGRYLLAALSTSPDMIGAAALKLANDGKTEAARTWLNWARESIAAGGGDDPLSGPPFAKLWQKEKPTTSLDEIRLAAASLMSSKTHAKDGVPVLLALRDGAPTDDARTAVDVAITGAYIVLGDWNKTIPFAERLAKAHPDSGSAFSTWTSALVQAGRQDEALTIAKERLARLPKDEYAMRAMARIAASKGDYDTAVTWARRTVDEVNPTTNDYNEAAWMALFAEKELDRGIADARRATADEARASYGNLHTLAALYAASGKSVEARQTLLTAMDRKATDEPGSEDWFVLGRIAENYGVRDAALAAYKRVEKGVLTGTSTWELTQRRLGVMGGK